MRRVVVLFVCIGLLIGLFAVCTPKEPTAVDKPEDNAPTQQAPEDTQQAEPEQEVEPVELTIWYETDDAIAAEIQNVLDELAPEVMVKVERKDKMVDALKLVGDDPASAPDMYFFAHDKIGVFAEMGILAPVTDFISMDVLADHIPMTLDAATYKDALYQVPIYFETLLFMYNKDLMETPPATTDDLLSYMQNVPDGEYGFVEQHSTAYFSVGWIHGFDGYVIDGNATPGLNLQGTKDALAYHKQFVPLMPLDGDYNTMTTLFKEGKAHSTIGGPWLIPDVKAANINLGLASMPVINATGKPISPFSGVQGVSVLKVAEEKKDAVIKVLEKLAEPAVGINLSKATGCAPARNACYDDEAVTSQELVAMLKSSAENVVPMPNVPEMDVMWAVTENLLVAVNKNDADPFTQADIAQKEAEDKINDMQ